MPGRKGRSGRRPKPPGMRLVDNSFRADRHGDKEEAQEKRAKARKTKLPPAPTWLSAIAKAEWRRVAPLIHARGLLTPDDWTTLACYCRAYGELRQAQKVIHKKGRVFTNSAGNPQSRPEVAQANTAVKQIRDFCIEFGFSPAARARLDVVPPGGKKAPGQDDDEFRNAGREAV